jgi:hypothetical protein
MTKNQQRKISMKKKQQTRLRPVERKDEKCKTTQIFHLFQNKASSARKTHEEQDEKKTKNE